MKLRQQLTTNIKENYTDQLIYGCIFQKFVRGYFFNQINDLQNTNFQNIWLYSGQNIQYILLSMVEHWKIILTKEHAFGAIL